VCVGCLLWRIGQANEILTKLTCSGNKSSACKDLNTAVEALNAELKILAGMITVDDEHAVNIEDLKAAMMRVIAMNKGTMSAIKICKAFLLCIPRSPCHTIVPPCFQTPCCVEGFFDHPVSRVLSQCLDIIPPASMHTATTCRLALCVDICV
jgi:hypothetical protein